MIEIKSSTPNPARAKRPKASTQSSKSPQNFPRRKLRSALCKKNLKGANMTVQIGPTQIRNLSLKQLNDIISDIYAQKIKYDQKQEKIKQPRETVE